MVEAVHEVAVAVGERFSWGARFGADPDELRAAYLDALHRADDGEITRLLTFARA